MDVGFVPRVWQDSGHVLQSLYAVAHPTKRTNGMKENELTRPYGAENTFGGLDRNCMILGTIFDCHIAV